ncbi:MAG: hypothetical protein ABI577_01435 [bacterium]
MKLSIFNSRLASVGLASVIAVGVIGAGTVAFAQTPGDTPTPSTQNGGGRGHGLVRLGAAHLLKNSGVTRDELKQGTAEGLTLGAIIDKYGDKSAAQAKADALAALATRLDEAVANGKLTQEQADKIEAAAPAQLDRLLAVVPADHPRDGGHEGKIRAVAKNALETVAGVLNTDVKALRQELAGGKTIAEVAGPQTQSVIDALTTNANAAIDKAVADGKLPADKADAAKAKAAEAITKLVNEGRPNKPAEGRMPANRVRPNVPAPTN